MKVLFATYPTAFHTPGGGEIQLLAYRKYLADPGIEVTLFDPWRPEFLGHDLVHYFSCVGGSYPFCAFVKRLGLKLVVSSSLWITPETRKDYPEGEIRRQLSLADRIVTNSDAETETLAEVFGLPREKFATVLNGVDPSFFAPTDPALFRSEFGVDGPFLLNVANLEPRKNHLRLAEAIAGLPGTRLVLIGAVRDPDYAKAVLAAGGKSLSHLGTLAHDSRPLRSAYAAARLFVLPSLLETPGLAALEAAAQGAPLLVTEVGSTRDYFGAAATYVDPHSTASIRAGIEAALASPARGSFRPLVWPEAIAPLSAIYRGALEQGR
ncbi:MAG: glycosyltransferase [Cucumibacter sp.]